MGRQTTSAVKAAAADHSPAAVDCLHASFFSPGSAFSHLPPHRTFCYRATTRTALLVAPALSAARNALLRRALRAPPLGRRAWLALFGAARHACAVPGAAGRTASFHLSASWRVARSTCFTRDNTSCATYARFINAVRGLWPCRATHSVRSIALCIQHSPANWYAQVPLAKTAERGAHCTRLRQFHAFRQTVYDRRISLPPLLPYAIFVRLVR